MTCLRNVSYFYLQDFGIIFCINKKKNIWNYDVGKIIIGILNYNNLENIAYKLTITCLIINRCFYFERVVWTLPRLSTFLRFGQVFNSVNIQIYLH